MPAAPLEYQPAPKPRRNPSIASVLIVILVGLPLGFGIGIGKLFLLMVIMLGDHWTTHDNPVAILNGLLTSGGVRMTVAGERARAQSVSDGFHGDGHDWAMCQISPQELANLETTMNELVTSGKAKRMYAQCPKNSPRWFDPNSSPDLVGHFTQGTSFWIGFSKSDQKLYVLRMRY